MVLRKQHPQQINFGQGLFRDIYELLMYQVHSTFAGGKKKIVHPYYHNLGGNMRGNGMRK